eukprot:TRINITY_DN29510_c0_g1_i2.p1 TRINITY_DN29510_c0_g1~~TRINITY_DN29510_c0_g1_i2.p1  ORF type:complete len:129 (+),score=25.15 TRINITY_DN29510_c0_g1_i2:142-528(+)
MIRRPPRSTLSSSSAASDVYKRQNMDTVHNEYAPDLNGVLQPRGSQPELGLVTVLEGFVAQAASEVDHHRTPHGTHMDPEPSVHLSLIHISEPTRLLSISYAVFCLKKKKKKNTHKYINNYYIYKKSY